MLFVCCKCGLKIAAECTAIIIGKFQERVTGTLPMINNESYFLYDI